VRDPRGRGLVDERPGREAVEALAEQGPESVVHVSAGWGQEGEDSSAKSGPVHNFAAAYRSSLRIADAQRYAASDVRPTDLGKFCQDAYRAAMSTMNISLPKSLKSFVDEQVATRGFGTSSEYVRDLIRKDLDRQRLRSLLLQGADSAPAGPADQGYFDGLRARVRSHRTT
jgi:antitoxin ParD1/3/4